MPQQEQLYAKRVNKANARQHRTRHSKYGVYRMLRKHERSHVRRLERHIKLYKDTSPMAHEALERYRALIVSKN